MMWANDHESKSGNSRFQGYLVDLIAEIGRRLNFRYELYLSPDGNYGSRNETGHWNGMIKELIMGVCQLSTNSICVTDIASSPITIVYTK